MLETSMGVAWRKQPRPRFSIQKTKFSSSSSMQEAQAHGELGGAAEQRQNLLGRILQQLEVRADEIERGQQIRSRSLRSLRGRRRGPERPRAGRLRRTGRRTGMEISSRRSRMRSSSGRAELLHAAHGGDIAAQLLEAVVADRDAEILAGHVFDLVGFVEHHGVILGQDAALVVLVAQREVGEEQVVVDDDDVAFLRRAGASG